MKIDWKSRGLQQKKAIRWQINTVICCAAPSIQQVEAGGKGRRINQL
jgi:hypothetical protein